MARFPIWSDGHRNALLLFSHRVFSVRDTICIMNDHQYKSKLRLGWIFVSVIVVLLSFGSAHLYDRLSARPTIVIENNGAAHLGVIPLKNKTVRHMTLQAL